MPPKKNRTPAAAAIAPQKVSFKRATSASAPAPKRTSQQVSDFGDAHRVLSYARMDIANLAEEAEDALSDVCDFDRRARVTAALKESPPGKNPPPTETFDAMAQRLNTKLIAAVNSIKEIVNDESAVAWTRYLQEMATTS